MRFLALIYLLLLSLTPAHARMSIAPPPVYSFCTFGDIYLDGCGQAPQTGLTPGLEGQVLHTNCFANGGFINQYAGTSTDYTAAGARPPFNVPGCDYPVGATLPDASLTPIYVSQPSGCVYNATGGFSSNATLTCGGSGSIGHGVFNGINNYLMVDASGNCVALIMPNATNVNAAGVTVSNLHITNTGNCAINSSATALINGPSPSYPINYTNITLDGNAQNFPQQWGTCAAPNNCSGSQGIQTQRDQIVGHYNALMNFGSKPLIYNGTDATKSFIWEFNFGPGWMMGGNTGDHAEFATDQGSPGSNQRHVNHNLFVQATLNNGSANAPWSQGLTAPSGFTLNDLIIHGNVNIQAFTGGMPSSVTSMTGVIGCGNPPTCTTHGSQFYVTAITGGTVVGTGPTFTCDTLFGELAPVNVGGGATSNGIGGGYHGGVGSYYGMNLAPGVVHAITGFIDDGSGGGSPSGVPGNVLTVTVRSILDLQAGLPLTGTGVPANTTIVSQSSGSTGDVGTYIVSTNTGATSSETINYTTPNFLAGGWSMPPTTCTSTALGVSSSPIGFFSAGNALISGPSEVLDNYVDQSPGAPNGIWRMNAVATCTVPTVFARNIDMTTRTPTTVMNEWLAPGTGC